MCLNSLVFARQYTRGVSEREAHPLHTPYSRTAYQHF